MSKLRILSTIGAIASLILITNYTSKHTTQNLRKERVNAIREDLTGLDVNLNDDNKVATYVGIEDSSAFINRYKDTYEVRVTNKDDIVHIFIEDGKVYFEDNTQSLVAEADVSEYASRIDTVLDRVANGIVISVVDYVHKDGQVAAYVETKDNSPVSDKIYITTKGPANKVIKIENSTDYDIKMWLGTDYTKPRLYIDDHAEVTHSAIEDAMDNTLSRMEEIFSTEAREE